jgi:hypothetical protein
VVAALLNNKSVSIDTRNTRNESIQSDGFFLILFKDDIFLFSFWWCLKSDLKTNMWANIEADITDWPF